MDLVTHSKGLQQQFSIPKVCESINIRIIRHSQTSQRIWLSMIACAYTLSTKACHHTILVLDAQVRQTPKNTHSNETKKETDQTEPTRTNQNYDQNLSISAVSWVPRRAHISVHIGAEDITCGVPLCSCSLRMDDAPLVTFGAIKWIVPIMPILNVLNLI